MVILTTAALLKDNFEGGQCYCVVMAPIVVMAIATQLKIDAVFSQ